jgi:hypothetical protein
MLGSAGVLFAGAFALSSTAAVQEAPQRPPARASHELAAPVKLEAGGAPVDVVQHGGHAGPQAIDLDGDGDLDLLVGTFVGKIVVYRNDGTPAVAKLAEGVPMSAAGQEIKLHNW